MLKCCGFYLGASLKLPQPVSAQCSAHKQATVKGEERKRPLTARAQAYETNAATTQARGAAPSVLLAVGGAGGKAPDLGDRRRRLLTLVEL